MRLNGYRQQVSSLLDPPPIPFPRLSFHIVLVRDRVEMRQDELADPGFPRNLAALPGMQVHLTRSIGWEGTVQHRHIGVATEPDEA